MLNMKFIGNRVSDIVSIRWLTYTINISTYQKFDTFVAKGKIHRYLIKYLHKNRRTFFIQSLVASILNRVAYQFPFYLRNNYSLLLTDTITR